MRKTFMYRLYPTGAVEHKLLWTLSRCRELYNVVLTERRDAYTCHVKQHPNYYDEQTRKQLTRAAKKLVQCYQVIVFEDIQVGNLIRKPKPTQDVNGKYLPNRASAKGGLNKSMLDAGWGIFVSICSVKAAWAGRTIITVDPKFTSQVCSQCGQVKKKDLSERWHSCDCGAELDRDVNAAINILERGRRQRGATRVEAPCL